MKFWFWHKHLYFSVKLFQFCHHFKFKQFQLKKTCYATQFEIFFCNFGALHKLFRVKFCESWEWFIQDLATTVLQKDSKTFMVYIWRAALPFRCNFSGISFNTGKSLSDTFWCLWKKARFRAQTKRKNGRRTKGKTKKKGSWNSRNYISIYFVQYNIALT